MQFKAKLRKIGNSLGILIPRRVITNYQEGDEVVLYVITNGDGKDVTVITDDTPKEREPRISL